LLREYASGGRQALNQVMPLVYRDLRALAGHALRGSRADLTLDATTLVHECFLRLVDQRQTDWRNRGHFLAIAAQLMRRLLVDHARRRAANKRGGRRHRITLTGLAARSGQPLVDLIAMDEALRCLETMDPQQARVVEGRVFGGMTVEEVAEALGISPATVKRDWSVAKAWLRRELYGAEPSPVC
jgi:RNA polymerase sigma factor (TIGR02999 family)